MLPEGPRPSSQGLDPVTIDSQAARRFDQYLVLLQRWGATYNLTAVKEPEQMRVQHLNDSLAVVPSLRRALGGAGRVLDVGSGAGLPGVVIATVCPDVDVTCVEAVGKKVAFLRQVAGDLRLTNLHAEHARVETMGPAGFNVITSRAFASLSDFVRLSRHVLAPGGVWMAMKGKVPHDEIHTLGPDVEMFHVEQLNVVGLEADRCLVWMRPTAAHMEP